MAKPAKKFYRKRIDLLKLIDKIKLWPSRKGVLHGIKHIENHDTYAIITTHCNKMFLAKKTCGVPDWKLEKYSITQFCRHHGSDLEDQNRVQP